MECFRRGDKEEWLENDIRRKGLEMKGLEECFRSGDKMEGFGRRCKKGFEQKRLGG